jgi:hypothetical protein
MGATASIDIGREAQYRAFLDIKQRYETEYRAKLSAGIMSDEELMADFRERFITMVNSEKYNSPLNALEKQASRRALLAMLSDDADVSLTDRGVRVGDVVKVMDDGFWVEGVIVAMHDQDHVVVDFGMEMLASASSGLGSGSGQADDFVPTLSEGSRSRSGGSGGGDHDRDRDAHGEEGDTFSEGKESFTLSKKTVKASDCILVLSGEELEVGDKVEVCPGGGFMYFVGYIWKIHRKFDQEASQFVVTYDVCMENSDSGEALVRVPSFRLSMPLFSILYSLLSVCLLSCLWDAM